MCVRVGKCVLKGESAVEVAGLLPYVCDLELLIASVVFSDAIKSSRPWMWRNKPATVKSSQTSSSSKGLCYFCCRFGSLLFS